jgi:hypothetical protein
MAKLKFLESYLKHIQQVSDFDLFLKKFKNVVFIDYDDYEVGLTKYESIPYDTAYVFIYPS